MTTIPMNPNSTEVPTAEAVKTSKDTSCKLNGSSVATYLNGENPPYPMDSEQFA
jgi:hypothetical protein